MDKLKLHTPDITAMNVERIAALFPNCVTEAADEKGNIKRAIDFDLLKQELSADLVEGPQEHYRLDWPGKREALALANTPVALTLALAARSRWISRTPRTFTSRVTTSTP